MEAGETGAVETQVYEGLIEVAVVGADGIVGVGRRIGRGQMVRIAAKGAAIESVAAQEGQFVRQLPRPPVIHDDFDHAHDYLAEGTAGSVWNGILHTEMASRIDTFPQDANGVSGKGQLVIAVPENANAGWAEPHRGRTFKNAPYLFVDVPEGDFDARVRVTSLTEGQYAVAGLMARLDDDNFVTINRNQFPDGHRFATRSELSGIDSDIFDEEINEGQCALRLVRMGDTYLAARSLDGGQTWIPLSWANGSTLLRRPDLAGAIQVGLWCGTFNPIPGTATFDTFSVQMRNNGSVRAKRREESRGSVLRVCPLLAERSAGEISGVVLSVGRSSQ